MRDAGTVLLVANYESDVGYAWWLMENFWHVIATAVVAQGRRCVLAYPRIGSIPELIRRSPIEPIEIRFSCGSWKDVRRGLRFIRARRVRSIYLSDWPHTHWVYLLWRLAGVKRIVLHMHSGGDAPPARGPRAWLKDALHAVRVLSATLYVAPSSYMGTRLLAAGRVPARRCKVVTNGIRVFDCDSSRRTDVRRRLGVPDDAVLIVLVSRVTYAKGVDFAIASVAELLENERLRGRVFAVHCGDGPDLPAFEQMIRDAGISDSFRFLGRRDDVREILCAADIAMHPSRSEAMSLAILEFLCAGLAVVTSDLPSVSTAIVRGVTGLTYKFEDLPDAVATLRRLVEDPSLRATLGAAAAASCREKYSLDVMNRAFRETVVPTI
jgi:glycosyltransferase involved in cell wall biosynthesis